MEKQQGKNTRSQGNQTLRSNVEIGTVKIADEVVSMIAALAALEVDGVSAIAGNITAAQLAKTGRSRLSRGVKVTVSNAKVQADLALLMEYGYNIPTTSQQVQSRVRTAIETMTGLKVTDVNVRIVGIVMP